LRYFDNTSENITINHTVWRTELRGSEDPKKSELHRRCRVKNRSLLL